MKEYIKKFAASIAELGRGKDTLLAHISPEEADLLKILGGSGKRHPVTGLLEFDNSGDSGGGGGGAEGGGLGGSNQGASGGDVGANNAGMEGTVGAAEVGNAQTGPASLLDPNVVAAYTAPMSTSTMAAHGIGGFMGNTIGTGMAAAMGLGGPIGAVLGAAGTVANMTGATDYLGAHGDPTMGIDINQAGFADGGSENGSGGLNALGAGGGDGSLSTLLGSLGTIENVDSGAAASILNAAMNGTPSQVDSTMGSGFNLASTPLQN